MMNTAMTVSFVSHSLRVELGVLFDDVKIARIPIMPKAIDA